MPQQILETYENEVKIGEDFGMPDKVRGTWEGSGKETAHTMKFVWDIIQMRERRQMTLPVDLSSHIGADQGAKFFAIAIAGSNDVLVLKRVDRPTEMLNAENLARAISKAITGIEKVKIPREPLW